MSNGNGQDGQPIAQGQSVNFDMTRSLRNLLAMAERGQVGSLVLFGCDPLGNPLKGAWVTPNHSYILYASAGQMHKRLLDIVDQIEAQAQKTQASPIERPAGMPPHG